MTAPAEHVRQALLADDDSAAALAAVAFLRSCCGTAPDPGKVEVIDSGWDFRVFRIEERVLRVARRDDGGQAMEVEAELLDHLRSRLAVTLPRPEVLAPGISCGDWLCGDPLTAVTLRTTAFDLAETFSTLHGLSVEVRGLQTAAPKAMRQQAAGVVTAARAAELDSDLADILAAGVDDPELWTYTPAIVHADISASHVLTNEGRLAGIIDWSDARIDDPAIDLAGIEMDLGRSAAEDLVAHYRSLRPTDRTFEERVRIRAAWGRLLELLHESG